jgi:integrase
LAQSGDTEGWSSAQSLATFYPPTRCSSLHRVLARAGLPQVRFHDLRHTAATLMLSSGIHPKIVSEMLGHSTTAITIDLYSHVRPHMQQSAAATIDQVLTRGLSPAGP